MEDNNMPDIFCDDNNFYLGHGTLGSDNIIKSIFENGLRCSHGQMYFTTIEFGTGSKNGINDIKKELDNWPHLAAKKIIIVSVPKNYMILNTGPFYGKGDNSFVKYISKKESLNLNITEGKYVCPEFIKGYYDSDKKNFYENPEFYKKLSDGEIKKIFYNMKQKYLSAISDFGINKYKDLCKEYNLTFPITKEDIKIYNEKERKRQIEEYKNIIRSLPNEVLNKQIKFKDNTIVSFQFFLENYMLEYLIYKKKITLKNGVSIPLKHYIEEILVSNIDNIKSTNDINNIVDETMIDNNISSYRR